ncbi:hypothetical protein [Maritimibacter sp. DP1N21-5]|uniref:hypothetical protein n=1 Tax=Maritimibacter sp. DP1N21-5 TaxID=2836867 RepID=UPI001C46F500|nr:hypothetical protein [Maritimibacter sp. DP1N21-5]MBV7408722.1 hypothetical protein [Maritimibacter sp. DP1N21-5]
MIEITRLEAATRAVAELMLVDPTYAPVFRTLDAALQTHRKAIATDDPIERARELAKMHE